MSRRPASRREHQRFCEVEGWTEVSNARGKPTGHHLTYELRLGDGRVLRTRISRPANADTYGRRVCSHILDDQLQVTETEFWRCVDDNEAAVRPGVTSAPAGTALPASLAYQLVHTLQLSSAEIASLTLDEAVARMSDHWGRQAP